jgi:hypothetical protein
MIARTIKTTGITVLRADPSSVYAAFCKGPEAKASDDRLTEHLFGSAM